MAAPRQGRSCCRLAKIARSPLQGRNPITPRSALDIYVRVPAQVYARSIPSADFRVFPFCSGDRETNLMCLASPTFSLTSLTQANLFRRVRIADARCFPLPVGFIVVSYFQSATVGCIGCILVVLFLFFRQLAPPLMLASVPIQRACLRRTRFHTSVIFRISNFSRTSQS